MRARIAGESRLVFSVPDGFDIPYALDAILAARRQLGLPLLVLWGGVAPSDAASNRSRNGNR